MNPVFKNCNVCGRELMEEGELAMGCCVVCANDEVPTKEKHAKAIRMRKRVSTMDKSQQQALLGYIEEQAQVVAQAKERDQAVQLYSRIAPESAKGGRICPECREH